MNTLRRSVELAGEGRPHVLATVVWRKGPSSGRTGAKAIIHSDGEVEGWLGGACAEPTVVRRALASLERGEPHLMVLGGHDARHDVEEVPMACESDGAIEVYLEPQVPQPQVVAIGKSPAASALVRLADILGWRSLLIEEQPLDLGRVDGRTFVVIATQGHFDEMALEAALATPAAYVGVVASRKRAGSVMERLREQGVSEEALSRVQAPAGLDLGSLEPEELGVAILAELVGIRASGVSRGAEVATPETAIDPVCAMEVDPNTSGYSAEHGGTTYYFCSAGCQRAFTANPGAFV